MSASRELADLVSESPSTDLNLDNNTLFVDVSENRVGIGTTTPGFTLDVQGTLTVGVDDTGHDVKFFGATSGKYMLWDESADSLIVNGTVDVSSGTLTLADNQISGDKIDGGTISNFASTGIDDNASSTAITIESSGNVNVNGKLVFQVGSARAIAQDRNGTIQNILWKETTATDNLNLFNPNNSNLVLGTGNTERLRIDSSGNVGIGTTSPGGLLGLYKSGANADMVIHNLKSTSGSRHISAINLLSQNNDHYASWSTWTSTDSAPSFNISYDADTDSIGTTPYLTITDAGSVGIGTSSPDGSSFSSSSSPVLDISGTTPLLILNETDSNTKKAWVGLSADHFFLGGTNTSTRFYNNNTERMRIDSSGGIVTLTNPLIIGSTSVNSSYASGGSAISNALLLERSTSPPNDITVQNASNNTQAYLYCKQDGGVAKVFVMDSNGTQTQISTHTNDDEKDYEIFDSSIIDGKKRYRRINVIKLTRALEKLTGEKFLREWYD